MENKYNMTLSIAIPTYQRPDILSDTLANLIPLVKEHNIPVFIQHNPPEFYTSKDNTVEVLASYKDIYPFLFYRTNDSFLEADENYEQCLMYPDTEYIWFISNKEIISRQALHRILEVINTDEYSCIIVNSVYKNAQRTKNIPYKIYKDKNLFLEELGWHMTLVGTAVYNKKVIQNANFKKYYNNSFIQMGITLEYIAFNECKVAWIPEELFSIHNASTPGWIDKTIKVFIKDWCQFILSLPEAYSFKSKLICIRSHSQHTKLFMLINLLNMRMNDYLNVSLVKEYKKYIHFLTLKERILIHIIKYIPKSIIKLGYPFYLKYIKQK